MEWVINKENKVPLYLQVKDLIKYHISTGMIQYKEQLPSLNDLANRLHVNFETVRKAYKELERQGLVSTKRGVGTFVTSRSPANVSSPRKRDSKSELIESVMFGVKALLEAGINSEEIKALIDRACEEALQERKNGFVVFTECNSLQTQQVSEILESSLQVTVKGVLLKDLKTTIANMKPDSRLLAVITSGFHLHEVREILGDQPVRVDYVTTSMSPETRRKLEAISKTSKVGLVYRDPDATFYKDILRTELELKSDILFCLLREKNKLDAILKSAEVLLATPAVYETLKKMAPPGVPVFNVLDRVDPISLQLLKDRISSPDGARQISESCVSDLK
jgi:GntR family transcriptional regulator